MKIKISDIRSRYLLLTELADKRLPVKLAFAVGRNLTKLAPEVEMAEKQRERLCEEYADRKDGKPIMVGGNYQIAAERSEDFTAQIEDLFNTEVTVDIMSVSPAVLDLMDSDRYDPLTPAQIMSIDWMMKDA